MNNEIYKMFKGLNLYRLSSRIKFSKKNINTFISTNAMENSNPTKYWWLLITRGIIYVLAGIFLFQLVNLFTYTSAQLIAGLLIVAGIAGLVYSFINVQADRNYIWELLRSISDISFGLALIVSSREDADSFLSTLSFWAVMYAFIQAVQTMYSFMQSGLSSRISLLSKVVYFLGVLMSGGLAYILLMTHGDSDSLLTIAGVFPIALGLITILLAVQQKRQAVLARN